MLRVHGAGLKGQRIKVTRSAFAKGVEFTGRYRGKKVELVVRGARCIDKAGKSTGQRATLSYGKRVVRACAISGV